MDTRKAMLVSSVLVIISLLLGACGRQVQSPAVPGKPTTGGESAQPAGSTAVVLFGIGIHIEPFGASVSALVPGDPQGNAKQDPDYTLPRDFLEAVDQVKTQVGIINAADGLATIQAQSPFTTSAMEEGNPVLRDLAAAGNEIALHFHEDAHLGRDSGKLSLETWCAVMQEEIGFIRQASGVGTIRYWSGGNLFPQVMEAATCAGLDVYGDWKNPQKQTTPVEFTSLSPWRPAGGTDGQDTNLFVQHDPQGEVIYLPEGLIYRTGDQTKKEMIAEGGTEAYLAYLQAALKESVAAADPGQVSVFRITIHPGELRGDPSAPYAGLASFLAEVVTPLVEQGRLRWATYSQMADAYSAWEASGGVSEPQTSVPMIAIDQTVANSNGKLESQNDLTYCVADGIELKLDLYVPERAGAGSMPALLYVHGGAWQGGDKSNAATQPVTRMLVEDGFLVAAVNYRLAPEFQFPAMIEDVKCAVRYLRANAAALGIDPQRIGAWGGSAGGHLVSLLGVTDGDEGLEGNGGYPGISSRVAAVVDMFGPADLTVSFNGRDSDLMAKVFGTTDGSDPIFALASPVTYVTPDDPLFLILQGTEDTTVPPSQSQAIYAALQAADVESSLVMVQNAGHGLAPTGGATDPSKEEWMRRIVEFFNRHLK